MASSQVNQVSWSPLDSPPPHIPPIMSFSIRRSRRKDDVEGRLEGKYSTFYEG